MKRRPKMNGNLTITRPLVTFHNQWYCHQRKYHNHAMYERSCRCFGLHWDITNCGTHYISRFTLPTGGLPCGLHGCVPQRRELRGSILKLCNLETAEKSKITRNVEKRRRRAEQGIADFSHLRGWGALGRGGEM